MNYVGITVCRRGIKTYGIIVCTYCITICMIKIYFNRNFKSFLFTGYFNHIVIVIWLIDLRIAFTV